MPTLTKLYSMEEALQHNTSDDCWVVIDGKVYDVSAYMDDHPGGDDVFIKASGKDALEEFEDAGHGKEAREIMADYFIGEIDSPSPAIPELEISSNEKSNFSSKVLSITTQYWVVPVAIVGVSVAIGILYRMKK